jgi:hypothetical protein
MAIAFGGNAGAVGHSTAGTSFQVTVPTAINPCQLIAFIAMDNTGTTDADHNEVTGITDQQGNIWEKLGEFTNGNGAAAAGATISVWRTTITTSGVAPILTINLSASKTDKAVTFPTFTVAAGKKLGLAPPGSANPGTAVVDAAANFGTITASGFANISHVFLRAIAKEMNTVTTMTNSNNYFAITNTRSRNNASAMTVYGEYRIATLTGSASGPSLSTTGDAASLHFVLDEVDDQTIISRSFTATGSSTASYTPAAVHARAFTSEGSGAFTPSTATLLGSVFEAVGSTAGEWILSAYDEGEIISAAFTASGQSTADFLGATLQSNSFAATGTGTLNAELSRIIAEVFAATGSSATNFTPATLIARAFDMAGSSTATFNTAQLISAILTAAGASSFTPVTAKIWAVTFQSAGESTVIWLAEGDEGEIIIARAFTSAGASTVSPSLALLQSIAYEMSGEGIFNVEVGALSASPFYIEGSSEVAFEPAAIWEVPFVAWGSSLAIFYEFQEAGIGKIVVGDRPVGSLSTSSLLVPAAAFGHRAFGNVRIGDVSDDNFNI